MLLDPPPSVNLNPGFGESSLDFSLSLNVRRFEDQVPVQSELRKRILARFAAQGIVVPFPTRSVELDPATLKSLQKGAPDETAAGDRWLDIGVVEALGIPEGDSWSSRGQRPRKTRPPTRPTLKGSIVNRVPGR